MIEQIKTEIRKKGSGNYCDELGKSKGAISAVYKTIDNTINRLQRYLKPINLKLTIEKPVFVNSLNEAFYLSEGRIKVCYYDYTIKKISSVKLMDIACEESYKGGGIYSEIFKSEESLRKALKL